MAKVRSRKSRRNSQLAESEMRKVVTSANVACGFHAGDARTMAHVCELAAANRVVIGAHRAGRIAGLSGILGMLG